MTIATTSLALALLQVPQLPPSVHYGEHAVGMTTAVAVDARQHFDPWGAAYGRPEYRAMLRRVEASGQRRTVVFQLWYPATPASGATRLDGPRSPFPAASGRRANSYDLFFQEPEMAHAAIVRPPAPEFVHVRGGGTLADAEAEQRRTAMDWLTELLAGKLLGGWQDARPADGAFPVIVLAHGLGGHHALWVSLAEFLASHGYIVAAPTFVSDGAAAMVFHDEDSPYARQASPEELRRTYRLLAFEPKVVPYFFRLLFGGEGDEAPPSPEAFGRAGATIAPGGVERATTMMRNLFRQRVFDTGLVLHTTRLLGADRETCSTALTVMGATSTARNLCGFLTGRIDDGPAGVGGHSLGSMTAQFAADALPGVAAALGFNNGPPFKWTPEEMLAGEATEEGLPGGVRKPLMLMIGDEDAFVQSVFMGLFQSEVEKAGGDPAEAFPLEPERALPDRIDNPQPVAMSTWRRALSDRVLVTVRDVDHSILVEDLMRNVPWPAFARGDLPFGIGATRRRKPTGDAALDADPEPGERYELLGWAPVEGPGDAGGDGEAYLPHVVRDWYALAWFDWHLKGDREAERRLAGDDPFGALTAVLREFR